MGYAIIIFLMIILSAYFSASEISFNASNKMRLKKAAEAGNKAAALACRLSEDFTSALSAILIGNNLANIAASTAATVVTMEMLLTIGKPGNDGLASLISTAVMTFLILIFGEIVPKIIAKNNADTFVCFFAYPTYILTKLLYPIVWIVLRMIGVLSRLWGSDSEDTPTVTEEELSSIIETVEEEGVIDEEKSDLLQSTLDFRDTTVEEIMTPRVDMTTFDISDSYEEIEQVIDQSHFSRIPVYEDSIDNIIGILFLNHYYKNVTSSKGQNSFDLKSMLMKPTLIHKTMKLPNALSLLRERKTHMAIVTDEYGGTIGLVTIEDMLEELVGDIWDESDEIVNECIKTGPNTYEVSGDMNIDDFFSEIEFEPRDFECEYSTMGGWAIEMLNADPHVGDSFIYPGKDENDDDDAEEAVRLFIAVSSMEDMRVTGLTVLVTRDRGAEDSE